ncbi:hypothetical protein WAF17_10880 [Bernardetia sp. ABR2-2B]|uniref:hypothetical protein n=1 Tax=Bernardetia sp. ABR2-2B TaxID=3127472 RepID=UPI0030D31373
MNYSSYLSQYNQANLTSSQFSPTVWKAFDEGHKTLSELNENGLIEDEDFSEVVKGHYANFQKMLKQTGASTPKKKAASPKKTPVKRATTRKKVATKKTTTRKAPSKKTATRRNLPTVVKNSKTVTTKRSNPMESELGLSLIRRFLNMIGKKKTRNSLQLLLNRINKAAVNKEIRAKSQYAKPLKYVAESLVNALNTSYATIKFSQTKEGAELLEPYMNDKQSMSIRLLRQFYNAQNKKFTARHDKLIENLKKVDKDDAFYPDVKAAIKTLQTAKQNGKAVKATRATLKGLNGICKKKGSLNGLDGMGLHPAVAGAIGGAASGVVGGSVYRALSGVELMDVDYDTMNLSFDFKGIGLDDMPKNASILAFGKPKHGKSTFALQLANELSKQGSLLYVSNEEMMGDGKPSKSLQDRVKRIGYTPSMFFSKNLNVQLKKFQFIVIDSINSLGLDIEAWRELRDMYPNTFFVLVSQVTKSGVFRGSQEWAHDVDVLVEVKNGQADIMGRFGSGDYQIFENQI